MDQGKQIKDNISLGPIDLRKQIRDNIILGENGHTVGKKSGDNTSLEDNGPR
jgi:hypothetical protein